MSIFELYLSTVFLIVLMVDFWGVPQLIKIALRLGQTKFRTPLDCTPCFSFWVSCLTLNPIVIMGTFLTFYVLDKLNRE